MDNVTQAEWISRIKQQHLDDLRASGLSDETIFAAKIQSINAEEGTKVVGFSVVCDCLLFPYFNIQHKSWGTFQRVKPDVPFLISGSPAKYLSPQNATNHLYIPESCVDYLQDPSIPLLITEGEKKALKAAQEGLDCIALSGVWNWLTKSADDGSKTEVSRPIKDFDYIKWMGRKVRIVFDSDAVRNASVQLAAYRLQEELQKRGAVVEIVFLPSGPRGAKCGLDDYLLSNSSAGVWKLSCENTKVKRLVHEIRSSDKKSFEKRNDISNQIIRHLEKSGYFIHTNHFENFYFDDQKKTLLHVTAKDESFSQLVSLLSGLNATDSEYPHFIAEARLQAAARGEQVNIRKFSYYDQVSNVLYVSANNNGFYKLDGKSVCFADNGTDGVLFEYDANAEPFVFLEGQDIDGALDELIINRLSVEEKWLSCEEQQFLLQVYILTLFFGSMLPTRPILLLTGSKGSGKTLMLKLIGRFLYGEQFNVTSIAAKKEDAFVAHICSRYYSAFDNVDGRVEWLNDALARVATGQTISLRELYTTNTLVNYLPNTFLALSSRTPKFRRDDVVERLLIFQTKRIDKFKNENELILEIGKNRNRLWTEIINALNLIVAKLPNTPSGKMTSHRMADFADLGFRISTIFDSGEVFERVLSRLSDMRNSFLLEEDSLFVVLSMWLENRYNMSRRITAGDLFRELSDLAQNGTVHFDYKNPQVLAKRLKNIQSEISQLLEADLQIHDGHDNQKTYSFNKKL